jgi:hypothetical protein
MLLLSLLLIPLVGIFIIYTRMAYMGSNSNNEEKILGLTTLVVNLIVSLVIWILFDFSQNQFQFVQEYHKVSFCDFYLGLDGLSIYFVLLTTIIMPIALLSNWSSIKENQRSFVIIVLLLETLLLGVFLVLDVFLFYIFFESILPPLFLLIGLFGSDNKVRASLYLFLYTLKMRVGYSYLCTRTKFRGSPKALVTKVTKETRWPAELMTQGKVTSLEMTEIKWVTADLNQTASVKEQRVDGSSASLGRREGRCKVYSSHRETGSWGKLSKRAYSFMK